jgi:hypothetical protein
VLNSFQAETGERLAREELARVSAELGAEGIDQDLALLMTAGMLGAPGVDPRAAVEHSARQLFEMEKRIRASERERYMEELKGAVSAPKDLPAGTGAASEPAKIPTGRNRYQQVVDNYYSNQNPSYPTG